MQPDSKAAKILLTMYRMSDGTPRMIDYEDIVVETHKAHKSDFSLGKYRDLPDASNIHKPLYGTLKKDGLVTGSDKSFGLTAQGVDVAEQLMALGSHKATAAPGDEELGRSQKREVARILALPAYKLFHEHGDSDIVDSDLFYYLEISVRSDHATVVGRVRTVERAVRCARAAGHRDGEALCAFHDFMVDRFKALVSQMSETPRRRA